MENRLKDIIDSSEKTCFFIAKENDIPVNTIYGWRSGARKPNLSFLKLLYACSKNDEELVKNIKTILEK